MQVYNPLLVSPSACLLKLLLFQGIQVVKMLTLTQGVQWILQVLLLHVEILIMKRLHPQVVHFPWAEPKQTGVWEPRMASLEKVMVLLHLKRLINGRVQHLKVHLITTPSHHLLQ